MTNVCSLILSLALLIFAATLAINGGDKVSFVEPVQAVTASS